MGLGFNYLKILYNTIKEIASENGGIIYSLAVECAFHNAHTITNIQALVSS